MTTSPTHIQEEILQFWFGELDGPNDVDTSKKSMWWSGGEAVDREIRTRFGTWVEQALRGELVSWRETARGSLAEVIVLDQFTRNLGRGTPAAFAGDQRAQAAVMQARHNGLDTQLRLIERAFFYMPLMHAEDRATAVLSCDVFAALRDEGLAAGVTHADFHGSAVTHAQIVERFGRYPHRNEILGRECTPEEERFLSDGGPSFGQKKA